MALPTVEKTWFYNVNNKLATLGSTSVWHNQLLLDIKKALVNDSPLVAWTDDTGSAGVPAGIWTVDHSSDASVAGTPGDAVDRWNVLGDLTAFDPPTAHSWIVFNTGLNSGACQYMIDMDNNNSGGPNSNNEFMGVLVNWEGDLSGGTTGNAPTGVTTFSEIIRGLSGKQWAGGFNQFDIAWHLMMSSDGEEMRLFMMRDNVLFGIWFFGAPGDPPTHPTPASQRDWLATIWNAAKSGPTEVGGVTSSNDLLRGNSNTKIVSGIGDLVRAMFLDNANGSTPWDVGATAGKGDEIQDEQVFGEISTWDFDSTGERGPKGRLKDIWVVKNDRLIGDTYPADGSRQFHHIGENLAVPWNSVIPENSF